MKLNVSFPPGAYSSRKDDIKKVFALLDYKYKSGMKVGEEKLICIWQRQPEKQIIKGIFNGSGKECQFIIECNDDEERIFKSFETTFNARVSIHIDNPENLVYLIEKAKQNINKWWTWQKQYKGEPNYFYQKRMEKDQQSYEWFIQREYNRLKETVSLV